MNGGGGGATHGVITALFVNHTGGASLQLDPAFSHCTQRSMDPLPRASAAAIRKEMVMKYSEDRELLAIISCRGIENLRQGP